jgi:hypothetical protein
MVGLPAQLTLPLPDRFAPSAPAPGPTWRYFRWQEFETRPIPWTGGFAWKHREYQGYRCGTLMMESSRYERWVRDTLAVEWAAHQQVLDRYLRAMAGQAPERIPGPPGPPPEPTPIETWIVRGYAEPSAPPPAPPPRYWFRWHYYRDSISPERFLAVPPGVTLVSQLDPPVTLRSNILSVLRDLPSGWNMMQVYPPTRSLAPPIAVLDGAPPCCRPEWDAVYRAMTATTPCPLSWPDFHDAVSQPDGGLRRRFPDLIPTLAQAAATLACDVVTWYEPDLSPGDQDCVLLTRRALRHTGHTDPWPRERVEDLIADPWRDKRIVLR